jgi:hypothetical protein
MQMIVVLGPAKGRWARTRPCGTSSRTTSRRPDDGDVIGTRSRRRRTYGGVFRAQPAHDGAFADLEDDLEIDVSKIRSCSTSR